MGEGFFGWLKTELLYPWSWQDSTIEQFIHVIVSYIRWYNEKPIKISLGSLSPLKYRESFGFTHKSVQVLRRAPNWSIIGRRQQPGSVRISDSNAPSKMI